MVGLLGGCGSSNPALSESGTGQVNERGAVPWVDRPGSMFMAAPIPTPPRPADARPCRASDLQVTYVGPNGGGGNYTKEFAFRNVSVW